MVVFFTIFKGVKSSGKVVYLTAVGPYLILVVMLVKALSLEGWEKGVEFLFKPDYSRLFTIKIWKEAISQVMYGSGVAYGPLMFYGGCRQRERAIVVPTIVLPLVMSLTSLLAAVILFCFLGFVSVQTKMDIKELSSQGIDLAFIVYPQILSTMKYQ